jgi:hypothetical protein
MPHWSKEQEPSALKRAIYCCKPSPGNMLTKRPTKAPALLVRSCERSGLLTHGRRRAQLSMPESWTQTRKSSFEGEIPSVMKRLE